MKSAPCKLLQSSFDYRSSIILGKLKLNQNLVFSSFPVGGYIIKWAFSNLKSLGLETVRHSFVQLRRC